MRFEISDFWCRHLGSLKSVVFKVTFFDAPVRKLHASHTILDASVPFAFIAGAIFPVHLSVAVTLIILVAPLVIVARFPGKQTHSVLLVVLVVALVHIAVLVIETLLPFAFSSFESIFEVADVNAAIFPFVLALSFWLSHVVRSGETITVCKNVGTLSVLQTILPFSFVPVPIFPLMNAISRSFGLSPFADIAITEDAFPNALTFL